MKKASSWVIYSAMAVFAGLLSSCKDKDVDVHVSTSAKEDSSGKNLLDGPIPKCDFLTGDSAEMKAYRAAAYKDCANANTIQAIMNSVGCQVRSEIGNCKISGNRLMELAKEEEDILNSR